MQQNMVGAYGPWLADTVLGDKPGRLSFRTGNWRDVQTWRTAGKARVWECIAPVDMGYKPEVKVESVSEFDGLYIERLSWQLPCGPRTEAVLLKPKGAKGELPGVLGLHDHGGNKFLGWRKIANIDANPWEVQRAHIKQSYEIPWANELAKRGYAVLVHDTFPFASRRVLPQDVLEALRGGCGETDPHNLESVKQYNQFARNHEDDMEKSLLCAGTTWPGVYVPEDMRALDVLAARPDVDAANLGCAGLSGGGMRTMFLGGLDERVKCAIAVGFTTTWRDFLLYKAWTHTWMTYVPHLPRDLDFSEILALRAPQASMVLNCWEDGLYTPAEMKRADEIIAETYARAGVPQQYKGIFYPGGHCFVPNMQKDAFDWFDKHLKA